MDFESSSFIIVTERPALLSRRGARGGDIEDASPINMPMPPIRKLIPILIALWVPVLVSSLDATIVATLLSSISSSFGASERAAWLGTSYLLSVCCFSAIYGRLTDLIGRKATMLTALTFFTIGTLWCGLARSMPELIAARALAGMGGGGLTTASSVVMSDVVPIRNRGVMQGLTNIVYGAGSGLGGPLGGYMNDTFGWRPTFLVQVPLLVISMLLTFFFIDARPSVAKLIDAPFSDVAPLLEEPEEFQWSALRQIDIGGSLTLIVTVAAPLTALSFYSSDEIPFSDPKVWGLCVLGALGSLAFYYCETRIAVAPILPLRLLANRTGRGAALGNLFLSMVTFSTLYNFPLFFQTVRLDSAREAGLHLLPNSVGLSIGSLAAGWYMRWTGRFYTYTIINALMLVLSSIALARLTESTPDWITYVVVFPGGLGACGVLTTTLIALINAFPRSDIAVATGMSYLFRTTGQVLGVSVTGAILQSVLTKELQARFTGPGSAKLIASLRHRSDQVRTLPEHLQKQAQESYRVALVAVFVFTAAMAVLMLLCVSGMEDVSLTDGRIKLGGDEDEHDDIEEEEEEEL